MPGSWRNYGIPVAIKSEEEIAEQLSGHWREDHLFSLRQSLKMHDAIQERLADYDREIYRGSQPCSGKNFVNSLRRR